MKSLQEFIKAISETIINPLIFGMFAIALLYFVVAIFKYVKNSESDSKGEYRQSIMYALVGIFFMMGVFGIWRIILGTFDLNTAPIESLRKD